MVCGTSNESMQATRARSGWSAGLLTTLILAASLTLLLTASPSVDAAGPEWLARVELDPTEFVVNSTIGPRGEVIVVLHSTYAEPSGAPATRILTISGGDVAIAVHSVVNLSNRLPVAMLTETVRETVVDPTDNDSGPSWVLPGSVRRGLTHHHDATGAPYASVVPATEFAGQRDVVVVLGWQPWRGPSTPSVTATDAGDPAAGNAVSVAGNPVASDANDPGSTPEHTSGAAPCTVDCGHDAAGPDGERAVASSAPSADEVWSSIVATSSPALGLVALAAGVAAAPLSAPAWRAARRPQHAMAWAAGLVANRGDVSLRDRVLGFLAARPLITTDELAQRLETEPPLVGPVLDELELDEVIVRASGGRQTHVMLVEGGPAALRARLESTLHPAAVSILCTVHRWADLGVWPGQVALGHATDSAQSVVHHHLSRLEELGLVARTEVGRTRPYTPTAVGHIVGTAFQCLEGLD